MNHFFQPLYDVAHNIVDQTAIAALAVVHWKYISYTLISVIVIAVAIPSYRSYRRWRKGWLSDLIDDTLIEMRRKRRTETRKAIERSLNLVGLSASSKYLFFSGRHLVFIAVRASLRYIRREFWVDVRAYYLPSGALAVIVLVILAFVLIIPHPPNDPWNLVRPSAWWRKIVADLYSTDAVEKLFEGLVAVVIALIIFVAESIRGSRTSDEKRVLLKISHLWPLALLITLVPLGFLYPNPTGFFAVLVVAVVALTILSFGRVLTGLLSSHSIAVAQQRFLRDRIRDIVMGSARQRIGNKILFDKLGPDKEIPVHLRLSKSWLPGDASDYVLVDAQAGGILSDINLDELRKLAVFLENRQLELTPAEPAAAPARTRGPARRRHAAGPQRDNRAHFLRRFREEVPEQENIFARDKSILAIPRSLGARLDVIADVRARIGQIFQFSSAQSPSDAFRHEMQTTKDRLIKAIRSGSMGEVDDLRQTYLLVAEEFLTTLNDLGGGYTAEQARNEQNSFPFEGWNEVSWLRQDVRDLLVVATETDNWDVTSKIAYLPFAIAARALRARDHLLFQEFLNFAGFLYTLGRRRPPGSKVRGPLIERSSRYLKELMDYYVDAPLNEEVGDE